MQVIETTCCLRPQRDVKANWIRGGEHRRPSLVMSARGVYPMAKLRISNAAGSPRRTDTWRRGTRPLVRGLRPSARPVRDSLTPCATA
jgi:hypothetical protein